MPAGMMQAGKLLSARSGRLVATARAVLAGSLLLAVTLVPREAGAATPLIQAYTVYAVALAALMRRREAAYRLLGVAAVPMAIDFAVATAILYLSRGADSPFFSPLIFLIVAATIQWGARGALAMGIGVAVAFVPAGWLAGADSDGSALLQFVVRLGYLGVVTLLLVRFGGHVERVVDELARLTDPLRDDAGADDPPTPPVRACLTHALRVFGATRGAVLWGEPDEPWMHLLASGEDAPRRILLAEAALAVDAPAVAIAGGRSFVRQAGQVVAGPAAPLAAALAAALRFERALAIRAGGEALDAWVFVFDHDEPASEDLAIGAMVAAQLAVALDRWGAEQARRAVAAGEERIRLACDLHDGVLQFLAGTALQLEAVAREGDDAARASRMAQMRAALAEEQRELRGVIASLHPARGMAAAERRLLAEELFALAERLGAHWQVAVRAHVAPDDLALTPALLFDLGRFVREGVANAVRHGGAREVAIVAEAGAGLRIAIRDDGRGFGFTGVRDHATLAREGGPRSLHERASALGGRLTVESGGQGGCVVLDLPMEGR